MATKNTVNTMPEEFDQVGETMPTAPEHILENESKLLGNLMKMGGARDNPDNFRTIEVKREGELLLAFRVRPLSEKESTACSDRATKYVGKKGQNRTAKTDKALLRSLCIYTATVDEDRKKVWDNPKAKEGLNILDGVDMVDLVLLAGEKYKIIDVIDEISGFVPEVEEDAKN